MIYINESSTSIQIPRHNLGVGFESGISVKISSGKESYILTEPIDVTITLENYYILPINNKPVNVGEYTYEVLKGDEVVETGLLTYGDYKKTEVKSIEKSEDNIQLKSIY